ncbi:type I restriction-modification system subunit M [Pseudobacteriovorax antillogorgiicola]|uniref:site-specific DNA-methyltransferase (adenine-specific) n=1 Tax=Pseudobacteriovorax antillogorgiicola TaxID=1513793 RepID=A0A1Y6CNL0_9BACT|nr:type I restriction-modification system subunit M [Pseudobacteriovorax antillogorgiicola]TCS44634.1 type I restriction enzyme M protein [Pseudobacteriovorax antillogorgiicola]SMF78495.1 type I restriction enzyme M protein [Pseudobacteriovorax antillogorgiicola]
MKIDQNEVNSILWKACDTFRGTVDPSAYKDYILVMLFIKYISDVWDEHYEELQKKFGDNKDRIESRLKKERFYIPEGCTFNELFAQRNETKIGSIINMALEAIEDANKVKLEGVFRNIDYNSEANLGSTKERNKRLKELLEDFNDERLNLRPSRVGNLDVIGNAYEYLIANFAAGAGKKAGEFYTPAEVSELVAELVDPKKGERICDPACGSGSLLIKCANQIKDTRDFALYGQEINSGTWALAKMNMFLHGTDSAHIEKGDTLNHPQLKEDDKLMKFDVVVANPPFSLDKWGAEKAGDDVYKRYHRGIPPKTKGDYAFISHMIETINRDNGRVGVVVPHGVLFRGSTEGKIRTKLIEENLLDAVIGLPPNLFFGTGIPAAILLFKQGRDDDTVLFIDAKEGFEKGTNQNRLRVEDIEKIVKTYQDRESIDKYSYLATCDEIKENDYNLNIPRYVDIFEEEEEIDINGVQREIKIIESELKDTQLKMQEYLKELGYEV